jgi:aromatase
MTELRIWTARHTIRVAAPPKGVFEMVANIDCWPALLAPLEEVEHLGFEGVCERIRFTKRVDGVTQDLTMVRELNAKRMQVRFRQVDVQPPLASMGGIWLVLPKGSGSVVSLDQYYRVADNSPLTAARVEAEIAGESLPMLARLRDAVELDGVPDLVDSWGHSHKGAA